MNSANMVGNTGLKKHVQTSYSKSGKFSQHHLQVLLIFITPKGLLRNQQYFTHDDSVILHTVNVNLDFLK